MQKIYIKIHIPFCLQVVQVVISVNVHCIKKIGTDHETQHSWFEEADASEQSYFFISNDLNLIFVIFNYSIQHTLRSKYIYN